MNDKLDLLLHNGTIVTMDSANPKATAVGIKGPRIAWVGDSPSFKFREVIDLKGACVYPGFIDTHMHVLYTELAQQCIQLKECHSKEAVIQKLQVVVKQRPQGEWILGIGWDDTLWNQKDNIHAKDLDAIAPHHPVVLRRSDTHLVWVNSLALKLARIDRNCCNPMGGTIAKDSSGNPTGILIDKGMDAIHRAIPQRSTEDNVRLIKATLDKCLSQGITSVHNAATDADDGAAFNQLATDNRLPVRVYLMGAVRNPEDIEQFKSPDEFGPFLQLRCLKFWMDGALGSRGAALIDPYHDDRENYGLLLWSENELETLLRVAKTRGFQVAIHAIGDKANHLILNIYERIGVNDLRWRIEHAQQLAVSDISRFAKLQVIAGMQPLHATMDMVWINDRLGRKRIDSGSFVLQSLINSGAILAGGSDAPVADMNPLWGIYAAVTRQDHHQHPKDGWCPRERINPLDALRMYTQNAAYSSFQEECLGSITPGKYADLTVLPENILSCDPKNLLNMPVLYTILNGNVAFARGVL